VPGKKWKSEESEESLFPHHFFRDFLLLWFCSSPGLRKFHSHIYAKISIWNNRRHTANTNVRSKQSTCSSIDILLLLVNRRNDSCHC
jgi:hypothetical protein